MFKLFMLKVMIDYENDYDVKNVKKNVKKK